MARSCAAEVQHTQRSPSNAFPPSAVWTLRTFSLPDDRFSLPDDRPNEEEDIEDEEDEEDEERRPESVEGASRSSSCSL